MSLGSNSVDRERSLPKILTRHRGLNFCINCTSLVCFAAIFLCNSETVPNAPKRKETHQNMSLGSNGVDRERSLRKIMTRLRGTNFYINCTSRRILHQVSWSSETDPNAPKRKETHQNMRLGSNCMDRERSLFILTGHHGTTFCINCTNLARFAASFV